MKKRKRTLAATTNSVKRPNPLRIDPSRTITLRRVFAAKINAQFALLKIAVHKFVEDEDAFGLNVIKNASVDQPRDDHGRFAQSVASSVVKDITQKWGEKQGSEEGLSPKDINEGFCSWFAHGAVREIQKRMGRNVGIAESANESEHVYTSRTNQDSEGEGHMWVTVHGKHYDPESPEGVSDPKDLKWFERHSGFSIHGRATPLTTNYHEHQLRDSSGVFGPGVGLGLDRDDMSQVKDLEGFLRWAKMQGVSSYVDEIEARNLQPVQTEFRQDRVDAIPDEKLEDPILISKDNRVLDGTHRWVKHWQGHPAAEVPCVILDLDAEKALALIREWPGASYAENANPQESLRENLSENANPYHDSTGRFATADQEKVHSVLQAKPFGLHPSVVAKQSGIKEKVAKSVLDELTKSGHAVEKGGLYHPSRTMTTTPSPTVPPVTSSPLSSSGKGVTDGVLKAFNELEKGSHGLVSIKDVHEKTGGNNLAKTHEAINDLRKQGVLSGVIYEARNPNASIIAHGIKERDSVIGHVQRRTENYSSDQERDSHGRWGSGSTVGKIVSAMVKLGATVAHIEHVAKSWVIDGCEAAVSLLPQRAQSIVKASFFATKLVGGKALNAAFVNFTMGQSMAERVAKERGNTPEQARRLRGILSSVDCKTFELLKVGALSGIHALHIPMAVSATVPVASCAYIAYSTAKNPLATARAAIGVVDDVAKWGKDKLGIKDEKSPYSSFVTHVDEQLTPLMISLTEYDWSDWYIAILHAAIDKTGNLNDAIKLADDACERHPTEGMLNPSDDVNELFGPVTTNARMEDEEFGHWVTTEEGRHLFISGDGTVLPHGPRKLGESTQGKYQHGEQRPGSDSSGSGRVHGVLESGSSQLAETAGGPERQETSGQGHDGSKPVGEGTPQSNPSEGIASKHDHEQLRDVGDVTKRLERFENFFRSKGQHEVADWMGQLKDHVANVGGQAALDALGKAGTPGTTHEVQYWGVATAEDRWHHMGDFIQSYLARNGIHTVIEHSDPKLPLVSAYGKTDKFVASQDFKPNIGSFQNKLDESKSIPGLEKSEDINKLMGKPVTHLTDEVINKLDETHGKGQWIVKAYGDEAAAGYGIFFPQRAQAIRQDAQNTIWQAGEHLDKYGFKLGRNLDGKVFGIIHNSGDIYQFGTHEYDHTIHGDVKNWAEKAAVAAHNEHGAMLPDDGKEFMAQPAFKAVGISDAERAAGKTFHATNEGRVHLMVRDGKAEVIPHSTWLKGGNLPVVFENDDTRAMAKAAQDVINQLPEHARKGQVYAPDVMKTPNGYKVVELNPQGDAAGSGYLTDNHFTIDAYTSHLTGREPLHVQFIRNLLTKHKKDKEFVEGREVKNSEMPNWWQVLNAHLNKDELEAWAQTVQVAPMGPMYGWEPYMHNSFEDTLTRGPQYHNEPYLHNAATLSKKDWIGNVDKDEESDIHVRNSSIPLFKERVRNAGEFSFATSSDKVLAFQRWLSQQMQSFITGRTQEDLWRMYAEAGYRKGAGRAFDDAKGVLKGQKALDYYSGTKDEFLRSSFANPVSVEKVKLLAGRSFDDLENITADMSTRMSRVLTDGLVQGQSPREVARALNKAVDIGSKRALDIAATECIRCHAEGQLDALERLGVEQVGAAVEWGDAGDEKVCERCSTLNGITLTIKEARGKIPLHVRCRCAWLPADIADKTPKGEREQKFDKAGVENVNARDWDFTDDSSSLAKFEQLLSEMPEPLEPLQNIPDHLIQFEIGANAFCPTGEGGGVDATCSPGDVAKNRPSKPEERHENSSPKVLPWKDPPPKKGKKGEGMGERPSGKDSQTAKGDEAEMLATKLGFRSVLPVGKRNLTAKEVEKLGSSIDLEYDHSGKLYELKMCQTTATEYRLKAKKEEKDAKERFAKTYKATPYTMVAVRDGDARKVHFYAAKEPGLIGAEVSNKKYDYVGSVDISK